MKTRFLKYIFLVVTSALLAMPAIAYDQGRADQYAQMFAQVQGAKAGKALHLINPDQFVEAVRRGQPYVTLDIRTPEETQFFTGNLPGHLAIPLAQLFDHEQLAKLPTDRPIVVMCLSGTRATAAATALRSIGFEDTYVLKGGFKGLVGYLGPKEANKPLGPATAAR
ncbi:MAG: rhodanese-like domain-containing protein [Chromatiaceae bacterium]|nr:rhodanese-like domain-containing protein [Gammaproteobacteria bacterium]MCP5304112.1 rhodanese-like domain-containing protein [Chromatiaceae bacterium]MCP5313838.1 rhodanese-like domain-containing protein [Chromatiaceae bacterium]